MCGIFCVISRHGTNEENHKVFEKCSELLKSRGPDITDTCHVSCGDNVKILLAGSVLWTQGNAVCKQPSHDKSRNILLWNGDVYAGVKGDDRSDTENLLDLFNSKGVLETLSIVEGPYSFIYYEHSSHKIWFGRDPLGRISFLWSPLTSSLVLTSVSSPSLSVEELPPIGIFALHLDSFALTLRPWSHQSKESYSLPDYVQFQQPIIYNKLPYLQLTSNFKLPTETDLTYVKEFIENGRDVPLLYNSLISGSSILCSDVKNLYIHLDEAVRLRCSIRPPFCCDCKPNRLPSCHHPKVGVLFSGGLDSTILAVLADRHVPPSEAIDLYNVAFERSNPEGPFNSPDRLTGLSSLAELQSLAPNRTWNFIKIDVSRKELELKRNSQINKLIYPLCSILDDSLGCALWFAASGKGTVNGFPYSSPAPIVLLGMGADEMFGGYRKAKKAWIDKSWPGLTEELVIGIINLPKRNLGRDSRCVSDHSRVPRFPFIDERVVSYACSLPPWHKCYLGKELPEGVGDKLLLRLLAWKLGLRSAALLPKRALQFGSRIANSKETGHHVSLRLLQCWEHHNAPT